MRALVYILKGRVCKIRLLIVDGLGINLTSLDGLQLRFACRSRLSIANAVEDSQQNGHQDGSTSDAENGDLRGQVLGLILVLEGLRADDVGDGEGNGDDNVDGDLFRVSLRVGTDQSVDEGQGGHVEVDEVDTGEGTSVGLCKGHQSSTDNGGDQESDDAQPARQVVVDHVCSGQSRKDGDGTGGHVEQSRLLGGEEDGVDDGGREGGDDTGGDNNQDGVDKQQPDLEILEGVQDTRHFENLLASTSLVAGQGLLDQGLLVRGQEVCITNTAGHEKDDSQGNAQVESTDGDEHDAPALEGRGRRAVLSRPRNQSSHDLSSTQTAVPDTSTQSSLLLVVPLRRDHDEGGCNDSLKHAQQRPHSSSTSKVLRRSRAAHDDSPEQHVESEHLGHGELLDQVALGELSNGVADEEGRGHPGEVVADKVEVLGDAHDVGVVDDDLVEELQEVAEEHERHEPHVNLSVDALELVGLGQGVVQGRAVARGHWRSNLFIHRDVIFFLFFSVFSLG